MRIDTARTLVNWLNYNIGGNTAYFRVLGADSAVVSVHIYDDKGELDSICEWENATHTTFRTMMYAMKERPL